jgi:quercetin dioxygenase-like cupin family protein
MSIVENWEYTPLDSFDDPDDYRPDSELALVIDPAQPNSRFVGGLTVFKERIAPGDRIPLHQHTLEEVFFLDEGHLEVTLGEERRKISPGAVVFIPSRVPHGFSNVGETVARIHAVFPRSKVDIRYLERNPAPGTEGADPGPPIEYDVREVLEGDPEKAIRVLSKEAFQL